MTNLEDRLESIKNQQDKAREVFLKCQGAIEIILSMIEEVEKDIPNDDINKKVKEKKDKK